MPQKKWCQVCGENYTHVTQDCHHIARMAREFHANAPQSSTWPNSAQTKQAQPVLGAQPRAPRTIGLRYVDTNEAQQGLEWVSSQPYYGEEDYQQTDQMRKYWEPPKFNQEYFVREAKPLSFLGPQPRPDPQGRRPNLIQGSPCFECGGDHWVHNCPKRQQSSGSPTRPRFPPIERLCLDVVLTTFQRIALQNL